MKIDHTRTVNFDLFIVAISLILLVAFHQNLLENAGKALGLIFFFIPGYFALRLLQIIWKIHFDSMEVVLGSFILSSFLNVLQITLFWFLGITADAVFFGYLGIQLLLFAMPVLILNWHFFRRGNGKLFLTVKELTPLIHENRIPLLILMFAASMFLVVVLTSPSDTMKFPDEYGNFLRSRNLVEGVGFGVSPPVLFYDHGELIVRQDPVYFITRVVYLILLGFTMELMNFSFSTSQTFATFMWAMLIPVTYQLGAVKSKKVGLMAACFIALNPILYQYNYVFLSDIPAAIYGILAIYFFYRGFENRGIIQKHMVLLAFFSGLMSLLIKPNLIYFLTPASIYLAFWKNKERYLLPVLYLNIGGFVLLSLVGLFAQTIFSVPEVLIQIGNMVNVEPFRYSYELLVRGGFSKLFTDERFAFGTFLSPYFYSHPMMILIFVGFVSALYDKQRRFNLPLILYCLIILWVYSFTSWAIGPRHVFIVLPIFMVFAASSLNSNIRLTRYAVLILIVALFVFSLPQLPNALRLTSANIQMRYVGLSIITGILTVIILIGLQLGKKGSPYLRMFLITSILIGSTSIAASTPFSYYGSDVYLKEAGDWINENTDEDAVILTNAGGALSIYAEFRTTVVPPGYVYEFEGLAKSKKIDYVVILNLFPLRFWEGRPYLQEYGPGLRPPPPYLKLTYEKYGIDPTTNEGRERIITIYRVI